MKPKASYGTHEVAVSVNEGTRKASTLTIIGSDSDKRQGRVRVHIPHRSTQVPQIFSRNLSQLTFNFGYITVYS